MDGAMNAASADNYFLGEKTTTHMPDDVDTVPDGNGWANKVDGETVSNYRLKRRAVEEGRKRAKKNSSEHRIRDQDGTISEKNSHGNDPHPPDG